MCAALLESLGDVIESDGGLEPQRYAGNPPEVAIGDHHKRPPGTPFHASPIGDVPAPTDGDHVLVGLETRAEISFTGLQTLLEAGHPRNGTPSLVARGPYSRQGSRTPRSAATASASS